MRNVLAQRMAICHRGGRIDVEAIRADDLEVEHEEVNL